MTDERTGRLLFVTDKDTGRRFLVDTGAEVSILPPSLAGRRRTPTSLQLSAANGDPDVIPTPTEFSVYTPKQQPLFCLWPRPHIGSAVTYSIATLSLGGEYM